MDDIQKTIYVLGSGFNQYLEDSDGFRPLSSIIYFRFIWGKNFIILMKNMQRRGIFLIISKDTGIKRYMTSVKKTLI